LATDVKQAYGTFNYNSYINLNNELFIIEEKNPIYTKIADNVEKILYRDTGKYIYLNTDNKIEMYTEYDHYVLDNDISSMVKMLEFVSD